MLDNASPLSSLVVGDGDRLHVPVDDHLFVWRTARGQNDNMFQLLCYQMDS
jgi:hypothetical protein